MSQLLREGSFQDQLSVATWTEDAVATNALATATHAAGGAGTKHYLTALYASYETAAVGLLQIKDGATVIWQGYVYDSLPLPFARPLEISDNSDVSVELAASGSAGIDGVVSIAGYTV